MATAGNCPNGLTFKRRFPKRGKQNTATAAKLNIPDGDGIAPVDRPHCRAASLRAADAVRPVGPVSLVPPTSKMGSLDRALRAVRSPWR